MIVTNAFSINMLIQGDIDLHFERIDRETAALELVMAKVRKEAIVNAIGHPDTDRLVRRMLNTTLLPKGERMTVHWPPDQDTDHRLLIAQYSGPRLAPGATELPEGAEIEFWLVMAFAVHQPGLNNTLLNSAIKERKRYVSNIVAKLWHGRKQLGE